MWYERRKSSRSRRKKTGIWWKIVVVTWKALKPRSPSIRAFVVLSFRLHIYSFISNAVRCIIIMIQYILLITVLLSLRQFFFRSFIFRFCSHAIIIRMYVCMYECSTLHTCVYVWKASFHSSLHHRWRKKIMYRKNCETFLNFTLLPHSRAFSLHFFVTLVPLNSSSFHLFPSLIFYLCV